MTDTPHIHKNGLPIWIVPISGWGDNGNKQMEAYHEVAKKWKINIEFSSRLGTFDSNKRAPFVAKEIMEHNENTFAVYQELFGSDWRQKFSKEVKASLEK